MLVPRVHLIGVLHWSYSRRAFVALTPCAFAHTIAVLMVTIARSRSATLRMWLRQPHCRCHHRLLPNPTCLGRRAVGCDGTRAHFVHECWYDCHHHAAPVTPDAPTALSGCSAPCVRAAPPRVCRRGLPNWHPVTRVSLGVCPAYLRITAPLVLHATRCDIVNTHHEAQSG